MKKPNRIIHTHFSVELPESFDNYMVLAFMENDQVVSSHTVQYPEWWKFYDTRYRYYIFSHN